MYLTMDDSTAKHPEPHQEVLVPTKSGIGHVSVTALREEFHRRFPDSDDIITVRAPGRVNLIGGHTDYNEGFVIPVAIDRFVYILASPRNDEEIHLYSANFGEGVSFNLNRIQRDSQFTWSNYQRGIATYLQNLDCSLGGANLLIRSTVPVGAGLSSSAAVEMASIWAFRLLNNLRISKREAAQLCQKAENEFVGVRCGIMDQFTSALARKGNAFFLDCRSLTFEYVPLEMDDVRIVICNTNVQRGLACSKYNERREECEEGLRQFQTVLPYVSALRDVDPDDFKRYKNVLDPRIARRCRHVIFENGRVALGVALLKKGDMTGFGLLMEHSHASLKDNYEVSCQELDVLFEIAKRVDGVVGARMTGAGFGGCTVNLVRTDALSDFRDAVLHLYPQETGLIPDIYICQAEGGVRKL